MDINLSELAQRDVSAFELFRSFERFPDFDGNFRQERWNPDAESGNREGAG